MQPLSPRTRARYLYTFIGLFFALLPIIIMYADGWRWSPEIGLYQTGGAYIAVPYQDADVFINGEQVGRSSFFNRSFYIGDLAPDAYVVEVKHENFLPWNRVIVVEPQIVTDASAFLFPRRITFDKLAISGSATSTVVISRAEYDTYASAFVTTIASTTLPQDESDGVGLFVDDGDVYARWLSDEALPPSRFCGQPSFCRREISVERSPETVRTARFFRGGAIYATQEGNVYFSEIDVRPAPINVNVFSGTTADVRVIDDALIIKSGTTLYRVNL